MTTYVDRIIRTQKTTLKKAHNERFRLYDMEYRIIYEGGIGEYFSVYGRKGTERFRFVCGFNAYKMHSVEEVIENAKRKVQNLKK